LKYTSKRKKVYQMRRAQRVTWNSFKQVTHLLSPP
jgi:hypothetical protein